MRDDFRILIEGRPGNIRIVACKPWLWRFWRRGATLGRYADLRGALMGLAKGYLDAAKRLGAAGRKERKRIAHKVAEKLVG